MQPNQTSGVLSSPLADVRDGLGAVAVVLADTERQCLWPRALHAFLQAGIRCAGFSSPGFCHGPGLVGVDPDPLPDPEERPRGSTDAKVDTWLSSSHPFQDRADPEVAPPEDGQELPAAGDVLHSASCRRAAQCPEGHGGGPVVRRQLGSRPPRRRRCTRHGRPRQHHRPPCRRSPAAWPLRVCLLNELDLAVRGRAQGRRRCGVQPDRGPPPWSARDQTPAGELMPMSGVPARTTTRMLLRCARLLPGRGAASAQAREPGDPEPVIVETPTAEAPAAAPPKRRSALRRERFSMGPIPIEGAERQPGGLGCIRCTRPARGIPAAVRRAGPGPVDAMPPGYAWTTGPNARESRTRMT